MKVTEQSYKDEQNHLLSGVKSLDGDFFQSKDNAPTPACFADCRTRALLKAKSPEKGSRDIE